MARPAHSVAAVARQNSTRDWWENERHNFCCYVSPLVIYEILQGDKEAAALRYQAIESLPVLGYTPLVSQIAKQLMTQCIIPHKAEPDAIHIGLASAHKIDFILTWNFRHLANASILSRMNIIFRSSNWHLPIICSPDNLTHYLYE